MLRTRRPGRRRGFIAAASAILVLGALGSPAVAERLDTTQSALSFDFDTGNAPVDIVFPAVQVPERTYISKDGSDASLVIDYVMALEVTWFDAIAPYHPTAVGVYSNLGRRPQSEATNRNKNIAVLYSSYRILMNRIPQAAADWRAMMTSVGLDPDDNQENTTTPVGIGNLAAKGMINARLNDGLNRLGNEGGRTYNLQPFADYTGYKPVNTAYELSNPSRWQPLVVPAGNGNFSVQQFVTPQMGITKPVAFTNPSQIKVDPPRKSDVRNLAAYKRQADEVLAASANLTERQKVIAEMFNDKFRGVGAVGGYAAIRTGNLDLERFVQYIATVEIATFDATIATWYWKRVYDSVRPVTAIRYLYGNQKVTAWGGPGQGTVSIPANEWRSYLNTANHPEYPSGSASICHSYAQAARLFLGGDQMSASEVFKAGSSMIEPGITPKTDVTLEWNSWSSWAEDCGRSRLWAGVHFNSSIDESAKFTPQFGTRAYNFIQAHLKGTSG